MTLSNTSSWTNTEVYRARHSSLEVSGRTVGAERLCPECGAEMIEFDRLTEDEAVFIWYACSQEDCSGQWLTKKALRMCGA